MLSPGLKTACRGWLAIRTPDTCEKWHLSREMELIDYENVTEMSNYWDYYESEWEILEDEDEEEAKDEVGEAKEPEEIDIFADLLTQFHESLAEKKAAKVEAERIRLRQLIGIKKRKDVSEETLITPEEASTVSTVLSAESSIHPCLKDIDISDSQLKLQNLYTMYPIPDDPGLVPAFWTIHEYRSSYTDDGVMKFFDLAKASDIRPIRALENMLQSEKINLQYYGIDSRIVRPLCEALMKNPFVHTINLTGNWLSEDACYHLNDLLLKNSLIHTVLLSGCKIGSKGVVKLHNGISKSLTLKKLDLSDCNIRNEGFEHVTKAICLNESVETLLLNDNHLDESCSDALQRLLSCSDTLKHLELSWNSLYTVETWKKLLKGLEENETLVDLDLSWNALGKECVPYLRRLFLRSRSLKKLHLNGNRFYGEDAKAFAKSLSRNQVLEELYIGNNPLKAEGAFSIVKAVTPEESPGSVLRILDLTNVWADKSILSHLEAIRNNKPWLNVKLGGILSNYKIDGPDVKAILLKRANYEAIKPKKKRRRRNFGHFVLSLSDDLVSKAKFIELVQNFRMKLSQSLVNELMNAFAGVRNTVDLRLLKSVYMTQYPNTKPPPEKPVKKKKSKKAGLKSEKKTNSKEKGKL